MPGSYKLSPVSPYLQDQFLRQHPDACPVLDFVKHFRDRGYLELAGGVANNALAMMKEFPNTYIFIHEVDLR